MVTLAGKTAYLVAGLFLVLHPLAASADTILLPQPFPLTSGRIFVERNIGTPNGFVLRGPSIEMDGELTKQFFFPSKFCTDPSGTTQACTPGALQFLEHSWTGTLITNFNVSLGGRVYPGPGPLNNPGLVLTIYEAAALLPDFGPESTRQVLTPFKISGLFQYPAGNDTFLQPFEGRGLATVTIVANRDGSTWDLSRVSYDITPAAPIPEPTTLLLVGAGLAGLAVRRRRHP
jgi:hypothetical protein